MRLVKTSALAAALMLAMLGPSCSPFHRSAKAKVPPAPIPAPAAPASQPAPRPAKTPEAINPVPPDIQPQPPAVQSPPFEPLKTPPPPRRRQRAPAPVVEPAPAPQSPPPPQLEQILTPQQQKAYNDEIDRNVSRAQRTLAALGGRRLNGEQQTYLERIRAFLKQADEARKTDLFRAKNLAERASLLADDLLRSVQ